MRRDALKYANIQLPNLEGFFGALFVSQSYLDSRHRRLSSLFHPQKWKEAGGNAERYAVWAEMAETIQTLQEIEKIENRCRGLWVVPLILTNASRSADSYISIRLQVENASAVMMSQLKEDVDSEYSYLYESIGALPEDDDISRAYSKEDSERDPVARPERTEPPAYGFEIPALRAGERTWVYPGVILLSPDGSVDDVHIHYTIRSINASGPVTGELSVRGS